MALCRYVGASATKFRTAYMGSHQVGDVIITWTSTAFNQKEMGRCEAYLTLQEHDESFLHGF